ncbi:hypothetical protein GH714_041191 [Hevea brasiliensis]|uniref:EF-hand domain-containing protein n=1 Tax=Hevea brasiliensis TaxID=3981 RepID=A0A6A6MVH5_HEVBR|nr:hypothetical protein GH714_041191 [Hevea brasiliensis]
MDEIRRIFNKFDKNGDGKISSSEVIDSLGELGTKISTEEVQCMMQEFDKDGDGHIDLDEFVDFIQHGGMDGGADGTTQNGGNKELKDAFDLYDIDKNGLISARELHKVMKMLGLKCTLGDCTKMIRQVDQDGDGNVNFEEFKKMMSNGLPHASKFNDVVGSHKTHAIVVAQLVQLSKLERQSNIKSFEVVGGGEVKTGSILRWKYCLGDALKLYKRFKGKAEIGTGHVKWTLE